MQTLPLIINDCIGPYSEKLQNYLFGILQKYPSKSVSYYYYTLITLDCMHYHFKTPEYWLKPSIEKFMKNNFYVIVSRLHMKNTHLTNILMLQDSESMLSGGCLLSVILSFEKSLIYNKLLEYGYQIKELDLKITSLLLQLFKRFNEKPNESDNLFNYVSWLLQKIKRKDLSIQFHNELFKDFRAISCKSVPLNKLLNLFCSIIAEDNDDIHHFKLHHIELDCAFTENIELNVCFTKMNLYTPTYLMFFKNIFWLCLGYQFNV